MIQICSNAEKEAALACQLHGRNLTWLIPCFIFSNQDSFRCKYSSYIRLQSSPLFCIPQFVLLPCGDALRGDQRQLPSSELHFPDERKAQLQAEVEWRGEGACSILRTLPLWLRMLIYPSILWCCCRGNGANAFFPNSRVHVVFTPFWASASLRTQSYTSLGTGNLPTVHYLVDSFDIVLPWTDV